MHLWKQILRILRKPPMSEPQVRFLSMPAPGPVTGGFAEDYGGYLHRGTDIGCSEWAPVRAPADGQVVQPAGMNGSGPQLQQATQSGYCLKVGSPRVMRVHMYCDV